MGKEDVCGPPTPASRVRYRVLLAACSIAVISYVHRVGFATASVPMKKELGLDSEDLGYLMAAFLISYGAFEVPGGWLSDRFGVRHVLTLLVVGWSLLTAGLALDLVVPAAGVFGFLLVLRFLFGMFQAGGFPALSRMMTDWMPLRERASAQGFVWMSSRLGGAVVPLLLGELFAWFGGWRVPLWLLAALGLAWCAAFWPWFRNRPEEMPGVNPAECDLILAGRPARSRGHAHPPWAALLRSRSVWGLCLMYGCGAFAANFFVTLLPDYLKNHRGLSDDDTNLLTSLPLACGVVGCVAGGLLSDWFVRRGSRKWGRRLNGFVGMACAGLAYLATIWVQDVALLGVLLCLTFFCNDLGMGPAWAACADIGERYAGTLGGTMNMFGNLGGGVLGAVVAGKLLKAGEVPFVIGAEILGKDLLFVVFACSYGLGSLCWLLVDVTKPLMPADRTARSPAGA